ncbi:MAG: hypothetical protein KGM99_20255 [Burkholderiales bacterium]|nr:hypothetical protein [Burkholderiales bacterium]
MEYSESDIKLISGDQLHEANYQKVIAAFNDLSTMFGKEWVEKEITVVTFTDQNIISALGHNKIYGGITAVEKLFFLWDDIQLIKNLSGFFDISRKLKNGICSNNVDLEVSVVSDLIRCGCEVELEPTNGHGGGKADCKFKLPGENSWVYVEISRKMAATTQEKLDSLGKNLAKLAAHIVPGRRGVVVLKKEFEEPQYAAIEAWLKELKCDAKFNDLAVFFTVSQGEDESQKVFEHIESHISVKQYANLNVFGSAYLHIPDYGAEKKINEKIQQLPVSEKGILIVDLSIIAGGINDWARQIVIDGLLEKCGAILLLADTAGSDGVSRKVEIILNPTLPNKLSEHDLKVLNEFSEIRKNKNLMHPFES